MVYVKACERECPQCLLCQEEESMNMQNLAVSAVSSGPYFNSIRNRGTESYACNLVFMLYPATERTRIQCQSSHHNEFHHTPTTISLKVINNSRLHTMVTNSSL